MNQLLTLLAGIGASTRQMLSACGLATRLLVAVLCLPWRLRGWPHLARQLTFVGLYSLPIILASGVFVGFVLGLQGYLILSRFGSSSALGVMVAITLLRELGPVVSALLFAGRAGTAMATEIGLMRATDQLDAMTMMSVNPIARVVAPRFWAGVISLPILCVVFSVAGIWGGYYVGVVTLGVEEYAFWSQIQGAVNFQVDVLNGLIKSLVFAVVVSWVAVACGFFARGTAEGVAQATTRTVVVSSVLVLFLDFALTAWLF